MVNVKYQEENEPKVQNQNGSVNSGATAQPTAKDSAASSATGFQPVEYKPSDAVTQAEALLNQQLAQKPGEYQSAWQTQLNDAINKILNREKFSYDLNGDALYQQYKDKYQSMGKQAMMDTMGNATALTGGYGSSYASTAGNQAYQQYLQQLNDIVPDLYQQAYNRYNQEGTDLMNKYNLAYGQHRDAVSDWESERNYASSDYWNQYNADFNEYQTMLNHWNQMAQQANAAYYTERDYATNLAMSIIKAGKIPTADLLAVAGISEKDAKKLAKKYGWVDPSTVSSSSSSSSKKKSSSSSSGGSKINTQQVQNTTNSVFDGAVSALSSIYNKLFK